MTYIVLLPIRSQLAVQLGHEFLDSVEHAVDVPSQPVELVVCPARRHPLGQVSFDDATARAVERLDPSEEP
jgi:hypothetical protein